VSERRRRRLTSLDDALQPYPLECCPRAQESFADAVKERLFAAFARACEMSAKTHAAPAPPCFFTFPFFTDVNIDSAPAVVGSSTRSLQPKSSIDLETLVEMNRVLPATAPSVATSGVPVQVALLFDASPARRQAATLKHDARRSRSDRPHDLGTRGGELSGTGRAPSNATPGDRAGRSERLATNARLRRP